MGGGARGEPRRYRGSRSPSARRRQSPCAPRDEVRRRARSDLGRREADRTDSRVRSRSRGCERSRQRLDSRNGDEVSRTERRDRGRSSARRRPQAHSRRPASCNAADDSRERGSRQARRGASPALRGDGGGNRDVPGRGNDGDRGARAGRDRGEQGASSARREDSRPPSACRRRAQRRDSRSRSPRRRGGDHAATPRGDRPSDPKNGVSESKSPAAGEQSRRTSSDGAGAVDSAKAGASERKTVLSDDSCAVASIAADGTARQVDAAQESALIVVDDADDAVPASSVGQKISFAVRTGAKPAAPKASGAPGRPAAAKAKAAGSGAAKDPSRPGGARAAALTALSPPRSGSRAAAVTALSPPRGGASRAAPATSVVVPVAAPVRRASPRSRAAALTALGGPAKRKSSPFRSTLAGARQASATTSAAVGAIAPPPVRLSDERERRARNSPEVRVAKPRRRRRKQISPAFDASPGPWRTRESGWDTRLEEMIPEPGPVTNLVRSGRSLKERSPSPLKTASCGKSVRITFEERHVKYVIGKQGDSIRKIQQSTGAFIQIDRNGLMGTCTIWGDDVAMNTAADMVRAKLAAYTDMIELSNALACDQVAINAKEIHKMIGSGGEFINIIQQSTGAEIAVRDGMLGVHPDTKIVRIAGRREAVMAAKRQIYARVQARDLGPVVRTPRGPPPMPVVLSA